MLRRIREQPLPRLCKSVLKSPVLLYFRKDLTRIFWAAYKWLTGKRFEAGSEESKGAKLALWILIGSIPIFVLGYVGQSYIRDNFRSLYLIAATLIVFGLLLGWLDRVGPKLKTVNSLNARDGIAYGLAQSLALIPGVSRSGRNYRNGKNAGLPKRGGFEVLLFCWQFLRYSVVAFTS